MSSGDDITSTEGRSERVPYYRYAFKNVYNYALMAGMISAAALTQNWWLLILGGGLEALWMLFAPDSRLLRRLWFDEAHKEKLEGDATAAFQTKVNELPHAAAERVLSLVRKRGQVLALAADNKAFAAELIKSELDKLERLVHAFADMSVATQRNEGYLRTVDFKQLEVDLRRQQEVIERGKDEAQRELARKNYAVLLRRKEKLSEVKDFIGRARAQLDLIENSFELLADQIVTMRSPQELTGQLDELIDGVEAVRTTARETDALLEAAGR